MSSKHFRILLENNQVYIEDNSSNGTYVNTVKLNKKEKQILKNGDEITLFSPKHETGGKFSLFIKFLFHFFFELKFHFNISNSSKVCIPR